MSGLKKRIVWNQAMLFVYVVLILGLPYLWLSVDLADGQVLPFLVIYALAAFLLLGLFVLLPLQYGRPLLSWRGRFPLATHSMWRKPPP